MKEVAVQDGVPNLLDHLDKAERRLPDGTRERLNAGEARRAGLDAFFK